MSSPRVSRHSLPRLRSRSYAAIALSPARSPAHFCPRHPFADWSDTGASGGTKLAKKVAKPAVKKETGEKAKKPAVKKDTKEKKPPKEKKAPATKKEPKEKKPAAPKEKKPAAPKKAAVSLDSALPMMLP